MFGQISILQILCWSDLVELRSNLIAEQCLVKLEPGLPQMHSYMLVNYYVEFEVVL